MTYFFKGLIIALLIIALLYLVNVDRRLYLALLVATPFIFLLLFHKEME